MRIPLKYIHIKGGVAISGYGPIAQSRDGKPVGWLDTDSHTVVYANPERDEVPVENVAKMRRAEEVAKK